MEKSIDSQNAKILEYLNNGFRLTPIEALNKFGCLRLSARIYDLIKLGYKIEKNIIAVAGNKHVAQYFIEKTNKE